MSECDVKYANILLRNVLKFSNAGVIYFVRLNKDTLGMCYPYNKPSPYEYFNCINDNTEVNKPIATSTRKPGMLVSYENFKKGILSKSIVRITYSLELYGIDYTA